MDDEEKVLHLTGPKKGKNANRVDLSKNGCFNGGMVVENELIWFWYIRRGSVPGVNEITTGSNSLNYILNPY
jgi:hypothetical protein